MTSEETLFLAQQNSEKTKQTYERGLRLLAEFTNDRPPVEITDVDVVAWKQALAASGQAPASQFSAWSGAKSFFTWLVRSGRLARSPFDAVKSPKVTANRSPRIPTAEEFSRLVANVADDRDRAIIYLLANGLRVSEVVNIRANDLLIDRDESTVLVRVIGKGDKERLVPLSEPAARALGRWLRHQINPDRLFWVTVRQVQEAVYRTARRAGVAGISAHSLRHYYATRLIRSGAPLPAVQKLLGHERLNTTQVYVNLDVSDAIAASKLDPLK